MFTNLIIEQTPKTPQIDLNKYTGDLIFSGRSTPEDAARIFEPVLDWASQYVKAPKPVTNVRLNLDYFNTTTAIWLAKVIRLLVSTQEPEQVLIMHLYLPVDEYDTLKDFNDIRDAFIPIADILHDDTHNLGIKLYGKDEQGQTIRETLLFFEAEQFVNMELA
jgi:hypothetical protein